MALDRKLKSQDLLVGPGRALARAMLKAVGFTDDILAILNKHGLTSHQSLDPLERLGGIIEMGQRVAKGTTQ